MKASRWMGFLAVASVVLGVTSARPAGDLPAGPAPPPDAGALFRRYCAACHGLWGRGDGPNAPSLGETQPRDLTDPAYMGKLSDAHLLKVISEGGRAVGRSPFMPAFGKTIPRAKLLGLAAYVRGLHAAKAAARERRGREPELGARLVVELGCPNCHRVGALAPQLIAPPLDRAGEKFRAEWLVSFLRSPHRVRPAGYLPVSASRMPGFRLSQGEAEALAAYLLVRRREKGDRGEGAPCGRANRERGFQLLLQYGCRACHAFDGGGGVAGPDLERAGGRLRPGWVARFVKDPRSLDPQNAMPRLGVTREQACHIAELLSTKRGVEGDELPERLVARGETLFGELGCAACHGRAEEAGRPGGPPDLTHLGEKLRPEWLRRFLKGPRPLRAWLKVRMPDFSLSDREVEALVSFFVPRRGEPATLGLLRLREEERPADPASVEKGKALFAAYECAKCHPEPGAPLRAGAEAASLAPSLRDAGRRLKPEWVLRFLRDPQSVYPGTRMPNFFYDGGEPLEEDAEGKMAAVRDYLISLGH